MTARPKHKSRKWRDFRLRILTRDLWTCQVPGCGVLLAEGRTSARSAVVDHIRPAELRPDLFFDEANVWSVCKACHDGPMQAIELRHAGNAETIAKEKRRYRMQRIALDGWPA